jgi:uncharacterized membrane protein YbhN (UPF0104 family)
MPSVRAAATTSAPPDASPDASTGAPARARGVAQAALAMVVLSVAAWLLWRQLQAVHPRDLAQALRGIAAWRLGASLLLAAASFACLAQVEAWATAWVTPGRIPRAQALRTGFLAHALANTLGFHLLTAGAVRWRAYAPRGLSLADVARVVAVVGACVAAGVVAFAGVVLVALQGAGDARGRIAAAALVALALAWWVLRRRAARRAPGDEARATVLAHGPRVALLGLVEMLAATGAAFVLLPPGLVAPGWFALAFLGAMLAGLASHSPGGLGVFEAAMLAALAPAPPTPVLAGLLAYRAIYNLLPFALSLLALGVAAWRRRGAQFERG